MNQRCGCFADTLPTKISPSRRASIDAVTVRWRNPTGTCIQPLALLGGGRGAVIMLVIVLCTVRDPALDIGLREVRSCDSVNGLLFGNKSIVRMLGGGEWIATYCYTLLWVDAVMSMIEYPRGGLTHRSRRAETLLETVCFFYLLPLSFFSFLLFYMHGKCPVSAHQYSAKPCGALRPWLPAPLSLDSR